MAEVGKSRDWSEKANLSAMVHAEMLKSQASVDEWLKWCNTATLVVVASLVVASIVVVLRQSSSSASSTSRGHYERLSDEPQRDDVQDAADGGGNKEKQELYSDEDGTASEETQRQFSVRWQNVTLTAVSIAGFLVALIEVVEASVQSWSKAPSIWLDFALWALLAAQTFLIVRERQDIRRFHLASAQLVAFAATSISHILRAYWLSRREFTEETSLQSALEWTKASLVFAGLVIAGSYPRRPSLFHGDLPVDDQYSSSAWSRNTWGWTLSLMSLARTKKLELKDLPALDHANRCSDLLKSFYAQNKDRHLVLKLAYSLRRGLIRQQIYTGFDSIFNFAPQLALYQLLQLFEERDQGIAIGSRAVVWVVAFGFLQLAEGYIFARSWWYSESGVYVPLRAQLGALVFAKSMRKKDVKGTGAKKGEDEEESSDQPNGKSKDHKNGNAKTEDVEAAPAKEADEAELMRKSRQGVVNLIGVDAQRIGLLGLYNNLLGGSVIKLAVALYFLERLVGWQAMLVGIAVNLAFLPLNIYFSKRYTSLQDVLMTARDKKLAVVNEALTGIRQIKFAALEKQWEKKILDVREHELVTLWSVLKADIVLIFIWITGPMFLSTACIATHALIAGRLEPSVAFTTVSILSKIEGTLSYIPELITDFADAFVSAKRVDEYLKAPEQEQVAQPGDKIAFEKATISWPADEVNDEDFKLHNISVNFPIGELSVISGKTGSGKSLLLSAILGECELHSGSITMPLAPTVEERNDKNANKGNWILPNAMAFVPQIPWIENATFKDNIVFGLPFDEDRYRTVLAACSLEKDLEILVDGDKTEIGPRGINLSGGQCWRLTLARALYSRAGILVLDDIFSAVDAHVGRHIFENALTGPISENRTRILVTHHVALCLPKTKYEVHLGDGAVTYAGLIDDLQRSGVLQTVLEDESAVADEVETAESTLETDVVHRRLSSASRRLSRSSALTKSRTAESIPESPAQAKDTAPAQPAKEATKFVEDEETETGRVSFRVYWLYMKGCGNVWFWVFVVLLFAVYEFLTLLRPWVLRLWTRPDEAIEFHHMIHQAHPSPSHGYVATSYIMHPRETFQTIRATANNDNLLFYLLLYIGVTIVMAFEGTLRYYVVFKGGINAGRVMFARLTYAVLRAPLRWLDTVPVGRILNRFTADFNAFDVGLAYGLTFMFWNFLAVLGIAIAGAAVSPWILLSSVLLFATCAYYAVFYLACARQVKRLESTAKSPIFEFFNATLAGVSSIRAYERSADYIDTMFFRLDRHARCLYNLCKVKRWLGFRFVLVGTVFSIIVAGILVGFKSMDAALGGFALTFTLEYSDHIFFLLRHYTDVELAMNSTERIIEYAEIAIEVQDGQDVPASWPSEGHMEVENLVVGYAKDLPPVLNGLNFQVQSKERIGVVGRTGAGKSSLTLALFRFLDAREGKVLIDGIDISKIKLEDLRSRLAIIPQDPVLFSGTVRSNLDPFDERTDLELQNSLARVHLTSSEAPTPLPAESSTATSATLGADTNGTVTPTNAPRNTNIFRDLTSAISEGGQNLSQGQRQLLCLARAIVARPKIMVLDEATSAVDKATDGLIQRSIREEFEDSTLIVIAHRLSTIADFDRVLVLDQGRVVEYDTPKNLVAIKDGIFRGMVESSGEKENLLEIISGESTS